MRCLWCRQPNIHRWRRTSIRSRAAFIIAIIVEKRDLRYRSRLTIASLGSVSIVLTAWQVKMASRSFLETPAQTRRFSMTSPALCSYCSSTSMPLTSQRTTGSGWPPTVLQVSVMSSPSSWGPMEPFNWRPHLSRIVGCSGGTANRFKELDGKV